MDRPGGKGILLCQLNYIQETYQLAVHLTIYMNGRLDNHAVVHREIQDKESSVFKAHFPFITYVARIMLIIKYISQIWWCDVMSRTI